MGYFRPLLLFVFSILKVELVDKILPILRLKPQIFGYGSNRSTN